MSIINAIKKLAPDVDPRKKTSWHYKLKQSNPKLYAEIVDVIHDWYGNGITRANMPSQTSLYRYLAGKDRDRPLDPPIITCERQAFIDFMRQVSRERTK